MTYKVEGTLTLPEIGVVGRFVVFRVLPSTLNEDADSPSIGEAFCHLDINATDIATKMIMWCYENIECGFKLRFGLPNDYVGEFDNEEDAILFKLTWSE